MGYCRVLLGTAVYYWVLGGYLVVLSAFGGTRGTDRHCGSTTEYWVVLKVLWIRGVKILFGLATFFAESFYFLKGFTSICLRISTRYKAIFINTYFDSNS